MFFSRIYISCDRRGSFISHIIHQKDAVRSTSAFQEKSMVNNDRAIKLWFTDTHDRIYGRIAGRCVSFGGLNYHWNTISYILDNNLSSAKPQPNASYLISPSFHYRLLGKLNEIPVNKIPCTASFNCSFNIIIFHNPYSISTSVMLSA